jgi:hypothetical protein
MADRIRSVHSSSRSRTRAPTLQFGQSFNLLRSFDHEIVICSSRSGHAQAHNIDRSGWHSPISSEDFDRIVAKCGFRNVAALLSPALARKFHFFAPLWTCPEVSFAFSGLVSGEIVNDH